MYKLHLILKYLRKRRIAWVSLIAVTLCTAMVLIVISVMGGWLETFKSKFRGMSGDVVISRIGDEGFSHYNEIISRVKALPEVEEALPLLHAFGLINVNNRMKNYVEVTGLDIAKFSHFNSFRESLWRQYQEPVSKGETPPAEASFGLLPDVPYKYYRPKDERAATRPGMIVGGPLVGMKRNRQGAMDAPDGLYEAWVNLEVISNPDDARSFSDLRPSGNIYWIVDASNTQLYQLDERSVYVPFDILQKDLEMDGRAYINAETGNEEKSLPRCHEVQVKLKPGADRFAIADKIQSLLEPYQPAGVYGITSVTWDNQPNTKRFLNAVENEKLMMTILFGVISVVAVFLIFCILYMIVVEKTRDIGIIKSVGATSGGVAGIFLGYGLAIGVVGAGSGLVIAFFFLKYINEIHAGIAKVSGFYMWDPSVYALDRIPDKLDPFSAMIVIIVAILSAVLGALLPAVRAARLNPVEALRFE